MKNNHDNTGALSTLLRTADSVDKLVTNSLCCAAAGIVAPSSATVEVLLPHEKLRGAALADVTLNTQEGPLAQPVEGDKRALSILTYLRNALLQTDNVGGKIGVDTIQLLFKIGSMTSTAHVVRPDLSKKIQDYEPSVIGKFQQNLIGAPSLQSTKALKDIPHPSFDKWHVRAKGVRRVNALGKKMFDLLDKTPQLETVSNFLLYLICFFTSRFQSSLPSRNCTRSQNSAYGTYGLDPSSSVIKSPTLKHQEYSRKNKQRSWGRQGSFQQCISFEPNFLGKHLWLLAIIQFVIVNKSSNIVHGGAV
ncbi:MULTISPECIES: hypothetical protein [Pseudomonas]|uniref:hypothetical protein n=1 Tax=Pseudomonas TaxID=286 RepID=UPI001C0A8E26|nr:MULTISPECIES: hypothetical protein [Pseudomonas]VCU63180.1 Hypothetical new protein [Pseudomonas synxantha]